MIWLRSLVALVAGYVTMVAAAWFAQEVMFPGSQYGAPIGRLVAAGFFTAAGGGLGGAVTAMLAPRTPFLHLLPMAVLITLETVTLYVQGRVHGPFWFEMLAGASLIAGTFLGAALWLQLKARVLRDWRDSLSVP